MTPASAGVPAARGREAAKGAPPEPRDGNLSPGGRIRPLVTKELRHVLAEIAAEF